MKGTLHISAIKFKIAIDSTKPEVAQVCQKIIDNGQEQIEAAIAMAVCAELKLLLPGITAHCTGIENEAE